MPERTRSLLVIGHLWPEPNVSAAGSRMMQLLNSFKGAGYSIHFGSPAEQTIHSSDLEALGVEILQLPLNQEIASDTIRNLKPNVVLFDRFMTEEQYGWRVQEEAPKALRILNTEDLHSLRHARGLALETGVECNLSFWLQQDISLRELSSILRSDLSLIISKVECEWLTQTGIIPQDLIFYLPFMLDSLKDYKTNSYNSYLDRSDFSFLGYGKHAPNTDAVCFLIREIWPQIRQRIPDSKLNIYGKDYPKEIQSLQDLQKGIGIHGWIEASDSVLAGTRLNLAPLRFGAGLKGKIVHAIEQGTPTVTTKIGAEGIWPSTGFDSLVADDPKEFAAKAFQIYTNEALWLKSLRSGQAFLAKELDRQTHDQRLHSRVEELRSRLGAHRTGNVLGRILQYQGHQSTRYMAKWIEAKNQS